MALREVGTELGVGDVLGHKGREEVWVVCE